MQMETLFRSAQASAFSISAPPKKYYRDIKFGCIFKKF